MSFSARNGDCYPCTVVASRYGGTYEGGKWLAFYAYENGLPEAYAGGDTECSDFWDDEDRVRYIGRGETPDAAYTDLLCRLEQGIHDGVLSHQGTSNEVWPFYSGWTSLEEPR